MRCDVTLEIIALRFLRSVFGEASGSLHAYVVVAARQCSVGSILIGDGSERLVSRARVSIADVPGGEPTCQLCAFMSVGSDIEYCIACAQQRGRATVTAAPSGGRDGS